MAAVWAAGPEPMMTTLECAILLAKRGVETLNGAEEIWEDTVAGPAGVVRCWNDVAAATESPTVERTEEEAVRRKIEENSLVVLAGEGL